MIVFLACDDYSNVGNNWAAALVAQGHEAVCLKTQKSAFMHIQTHTMRCEIHEITAKLRELKASHVVIMHSYHQFIEHIPKGVPYWVMHGGTRYRQNAIHIAEVFKKAQGHIIQTPDLLHLVKGINETFIPAYVQDPGLREMSESAIRFAHYPSNQRNKGTATILQMFEQEGYRKQLRYDGSPLPWKSNQERIEACQVYVELYAPYQGSVVYGTFGVTAVEASLMGRPVISQCANFDATFGRGNWNYDAITFVKTEDEFRDAINRYGQMSFDQLKLAGIKARNKTLDTFSSKRITKALINTLYGK